MTTLTYSWSNGFQSNDFASFSAEDLAEDEYEDHFDDAFTIRPCTWAEARSDAESKLKGAFATELASLLRGDECVVILCYLYKLKRQPTANQVRKWSEWWSSSQARSSIALRQERAHQPVLGFTLTSQLIKKGRGAPTMLSFVFKRSGADSAAVIPAPLAATAVPPLPPQPQRQLIPGHIKEMLRELMAVKKHSCAVCLEDVEGSTMDITSCGHLFHGACLDSVKAAAVGQGSATWKCPCCRADQ